ncbi:MAG: hypothetical protein HY321_06700 [Armatimonadetes bacterium]|nr:hypothetical protein [Armatimonadota bacterium]
MRSHIQRLFGLVLLPCLLFASASCRRSPAVTDATPAAVSVAVSDGPGAGATAASSAAGAKGKAGPRASAPKAPAVPATERSIRKMMAPFYRRHLIEGYREFGARDKKWGADARAFIEGFVNAYCGQPGAPAHEALLEQGAALRKAHCDDPFVTYAYATYLQDCEGDDGQAIPLFQRAARGFHPSKRKCAIPALAAIRAAQSYRGSTEVDPTGAESTLGIAAQLTAESLCDGSYLPGEERLLLHNVRWMVSEAAGKVLQCLEGRGNINPRALKLLQARSEVDKGWEERGFGWASSVTPEAAEGFREHLGKARDILIQEWELHPDYPYAAAEMAAITMAAGAKPGMTPRLWFDRAVAAQVDYLPAYDALRTSLLPRWGGSLEQLHEFGLECLNTRRFDTDVPRQYLYALQALERDLGGGPHYWQLPETYPRLIVLANGMAKQTQGRMRRLWESMPVAAGWYCDRCDDAKRDLDALGDRYDHAAFRELMGVAGRTALSEIHGHARPYGPSVRKARDLADKGDYQGSLALLERVRGDARADPLALQYIDRCIGETRGNQQLNNGEWTDLRVDPTLSSWHWAKGVWKMAADGAIEGSSTRQGLMLDYRQPFGPRWEMRGEVEFVSSPYSQQNAGVIFLRPSGYSDYSSFLVYRDTKESSLGQFFEAEDAVRRPVPPASRHTFRVRVENERVSTFVDGKPVHTDVAIGEPGTAPGSRAGIGGHYWYDKAVVRFRKLQVRRLRG